ncbi:hypothetical protein [Citrobacter koseri]|uniref:hypothetical protein n=1 Tax=Citrobacter koseri TaxID=545 RepID=UPI00200A1F44|nr:hypothetical protein [Citrobacter koseri]
MTKKFELVAELTKEFFGRKLFRIRAVVSFGDVSEGDLGGWVETESNLDQSGNAWVYGDAQVYGNAWVYGDAQVYGNAWVYGDARVSGNAQVYGNAWVYGDARVSGNAWVYGDARVSGNAHWITIGPIGSENGFLTAFRQKDNSIVVSRGCFSGTIDEFESAVKERHGDSENAQIYLALIPVIKLRLDEVNDE